MNREIAEEFIPYPRPDRRRPESYPLQKIEAENTRLQEQNANTQDRPLHVEQSYPASPPDLQLDNNEARLLHNEHSNPDDRSLQQPHLFTIIRNNLTTIIIFVVSILVFIVGLCVFHFFILWVHFLIVKFQVRDDAEDTE